MVKKFLKFIGYFLFFIFMLIFFSPKENLYYLAEKELAKKSILISKESIKDSGFSFNIKKSLQLRQDMRLIIIRIENNSHSQINNLNQGKHEKNRNNFDYISFCSKYSSCCRG